MSGPTLYVPVTWAELLDRDPRRLRRLIAQRYQAEAARIEDTARRYGPELATLERFHHRTTRLLDEATTLATQYADGPGIYQPGPNPFDDSPARIAERRRTALQDSRDFGREHPGWFDQSRREGARRAS